MSSKLKPLRIPFLEVKQHGRSFFFVSLAASDIVRISYVARRGIDEEKGAVQRALNSARITSIREFVLAGGVFPTSIVLNWVEKKTAPQVESGKLVIQRSPRNAQIIDGQHRVLGLAEAIAKNKSLAKFHMPVSLYSGLETQACADIFLSINTEQKPVPKSLVYDLYSVASNYLLDPPAVRAGDLAHRLNEDSTSPYYGLIKFPGAPRGQQGLALSTLVAAVKPLVEEKGVFEQVGLSELKMQSQFLMNFFSVLRSAYGAEWEARSNVFRMAAGFVGAIEFIKNKLVVHCNINADFTTKAIAKVMNISPDNLIRRDIIEGLQGRRAYGQVAASLEALFDPTEGKERKIRV